MCVAYVVPCIVVYAGLCLGGCVCACACAYAYVQDSVYDDVCEDAYQSYSAEKSLVYQEGEMLLDGHFQCEHNL